MIEALIVVDMQNAFFVRPHDGLVAAVNQRVADAVANGHPVLYTRDIAPTDLPPGDPQGATELHPGLDVRGPVLPKGPGKDGNFSAFILSPPGTPPGHGLLGPLAAYLRAARAERVRLIGIAADVCVAATARDAVRLSYPATVELAATAFVGAHPHGNDAAVTELIEAGVDVIGPPAPPGSSAGLCH